MLSGLHGPSVSVALADRLVLEPLGAWKGLGQVPWAKAPLIRGGNRYGKARGVTRFCGSQFSTSPRQYPLCSQQSPRQGTAQVVGSHGLDVIVKVPQARTD